jgi:hypothetical protein
MKSHRLAATLVVLLLASAPLALAQTGTGKKKGTKAAASASASASADAASAAAAAPAPAPTPDPAPEPSASASAAPAELPEGAVRGDNGGTDNSDTKEIDGKSYYFVGVKYLGTVIPQFMVNLFANNGGTFYSNMAGAEFDIRKDGHSTLLSISYASYGFGDTLFESGNNGPSDVGDWSVVNSSLSAIYLGLDELWSYPIDSAHHWDFEYGFGVGLGIIFGQLKNNWVYGNPNGNLTATGQVPAMSNGHFSECQTASDAPPQGPGCVPGDHQNASTSKVGGYVEPNWFNHGSIPVIFPNIWVPELGIRWKPIKQFEMRLQTGFSLTGFWFGIHGDYGLEKTPEDNGPSKKATLQSGLGGML